jgi:DNA repair exonuclease SbcCD nuclease subunit
LSFKQRYSILGEESSHMKKEGMLNWISISDIHFGDGDPVKLYEELDTEFFVYVKRIAKDLDLITMAGDLFHRKLSMNEISSKLVLKFVDKLLEICYENDIKLRFIKGTTTHDFNQLDNFKHHELNFDFRIINTVECEEIFPDVYALYIPEEYMENPEEYYSEYLPPADGAKYDIIVGHGTFDFVAFENQQQESERPIKNAPVFKYKDFDEYAYGPVVFG